MVLLLYVYSCQCSIVHKNFIGIVKEYLAKKKSVVVALFMDIYPVLLSSFALIGLEIGRRRVELNFPIIAWILLKPCWKLCLDGLCTEFCQGSSQV